MEWIRSVGLSILTIILVDFGSAFDVSKCQKAILSNSYYETPRVSLEDGAVNIKLMPFSISQEIGLWLTVLLQDRAEMDLYSLDLNTDKHVYGGDMMVSMTQKINDEKEIVKVKWPHIMLHDAWTSLHFQLHYHQLLQFAVIPRESFNTPDHHSSIQILLKPLALSTKLDLSGVVALKLRLRSDTNASVVYQINCEEEYLATMFGSDFGFQSSVGFWSSVAWILVGVVVLLGTVLTLIALQWWWDRNNNRDQPPPPVEMKEIRTSQQKKNDTGSKGLSGGQQPKLQGSRLAPPSAAVAIGGDKKTDSKKQTTSSGGAKVTLGMVSSRAPSPGHDIDENTFDYINRAFTAAEEDEDSFEYIDKPSPTEVKQ
ncbi:hypothetical protein Pcinc_026933 [Petrolisthes cinctipes]|uniref:Uncharacterized protein n=1 Tax=Petrolisthes cinctipes TaxID=88211 RepID=A0AAE1K9J9_PETCI|nr:hypothetical protein Pcinc_026933 [Petrolisthes cinctipes]